MEIPLKTTLTITIRQKEDERMASLLADLVDRKLKEEKYCSRINSILVEAAKECMSMLAPITQP